MSAPALTPPSRHLYTWMKQETLLLLREPIAVFFSLGFPLVILAFIGTAYAEEEVDDGIRFIEIMFPALIGTVAANITTMGMPGYFADLRSRGVLKRYRSLPVQRWMIGAAIEGSLLVLMAISTAIIAFTVGIVYGLRIEALSPAFLVLMIGLIAWLSCLGLFLGSIPMKARTIQAISAAVFFLMFFGSGYAAPIDGLPGWLQAIATYNPLRIWFDALVNVYLDQGIGVGDALGLVLTLAVFLATFPISLRLLGRENAG